MPGLFLVNMPHRDTSVIPSSLVRLPPCTVPFLYGTVLTDTDLGELGVCGENPTERNRDLYQTQSMILKVKRLLVSSRNPLSLCDRPSEVPPV